jgi:hypothetical protein
MASIQKEIPPLLRFMTMIHSRGAHESGNLWKHKEHENFRLVWASRRIITLRPIFWCIMVCWVRGPLPPLYMPRGGRVYMDDLSWL